MIITSNDKISTPQAAVVVTNFILATGILTLPRTSVEKVKTPDVWLTVILGGVIMMIAGVIMVKLSQQFPGKTFFQYNQEILGKWFGRLLSLFIICYFISISGYQVRSMAEVTNFFLLESTPIWAIIMPFMWIGLYLIIGGINSIARLFEIILPITIVFFLLVLFMSYKLFEIDNLRPVLGSGFIPVLKGLKTTTLAYSGPEIMLLLVAFMSQPNKAVKAVLIGTFIPLLFYVFLVIMVIGAFSIDGVVVRTWPSIDLIRSFEISGLIFERFESLLLVIWIMQIFSSFTLGFYAAALGLAQLFNKKLKFFVYFLLPIIYIVAMTPNTINELFKFEAVLGNIIIILFGVLPLFLFIILKWKRGKADETI